MTLLHQLLKSESHSPPLHLTRPHSAVSLGHISCSHQSHLPKTELKAAGLLTQASPRSKAEVVEFLPFSEAQSLKLEAELLTNWKNHRKSGETCATS